MTCAGQMTTQVALRGALSRGYATNMRLVGNMLTGATAVVEKVALADSHGLRMLAAYVVPITGHTLYGILTGFPPAAHLPPGVQWSQRQRADGATIPHSPE